MKPQGFNQPEMALKRLKIGRIGVALLRIVPKCNGLAPTQQNGLECGNWIGIWQRWTDMDEVVVCLAQTPF